MTGEPYFSSLEQPVTQAQLEGAANGICKMSDMTKDFPELHQKIMVLRALLAEAADAFARGDIGESTRIYRKLNEKRAGMVCGDGAMPLRSNKHGA